MIGNEPPNPGEGRQAWYRGRTVHMMGRWSAGFLVPVLAVACVGRPLSGDDLGAGGSDGSTGDVDDDGSPPPSTSAGPTTTPDPTTAGSATVGSTVTDPSGPDTFDDATADDGDPGCPPDSECWSDADCAPSQTCLANCTCFGEPDPTDTGDPACEDAPTCEGCLQCTVEPGGDCQGVLFTCLGNSDCAALLLCQVGCDSPECFQNCLIANPGGINDFFPLAECFIGVCGIACI
jgi:hypothetical protein